MHSGDFFFLPCLEFTGPSDGYKALDQAIRSNHEYEWIFFLSKKAAEVFFTRLIDLGGQLFHLAPHLKIAAVGQQTAQFIETQVGFPVNFISSSSGALAMMEEFKTKFSFNSPTINPIKILLPRSEFAYDDLKDRAGQFILEIVPAYNVVAATINTELEENFFVLLNSEDLVYLIFASPSAVINFSSRINLLRLEKHKNNLVIISIGDKTAQAICESLGSFEMKVSQQADFASILRII